MLDLGFSSSVMFWSYSITEKVINFKTKKIFLSGSFSFDQVIGVLSIQSKKKLRNFFEQRNKYNVESKFVTCLIASSEGPSYFRFLGWKTSENTLQGYIQPIGYSRSIVKFANIIDNLVNKVDAGKFLCDSHGVFFDINKSFSDILGVYPIDCIGLNCRNIDFFKGSNQLLNHIKYTLERQDSWMGYIKSKGFDIYQMDVDKIRMDDNEFLYLGRLSRLGYEGLNEKNIYGLSEKHILNEREFYDKANDIISSSPLSVSLCFKPDFCRSTYIIKLRILALAIMKSGLNLQVGISNENYLLILLDSGSSLVEKGSFVKSIRRLKRTLKKNVSESIFRDLQNGFAGADIFGLDNSAIEDVIDCSIKAMKTHDRRESSMNFYEHSQFEKSVNVKKIEKAVIKAVRTEDIDVHFQPIVSLKTGRIERFEALCRFNPNEVHCSVYEMIMTAESLGLIHAIDKMVCLRAVELFNDIVPRSDERLSLSINCSLADREQGSQYLSDMYRLVNRYKPTEFDITVEITESNYFGNAVENLSLINTMRSEGIRIAIDDFGAGSSSFSYFNDFIFDVLKIDRDFIQDIHIIKHKYYSVKMLTELCHSLGIKVVAEGVETEEELNVVRELGVDYVQGFIFSRPLPVNEIVKSQDINDILKHKIIQNYSA